MKTVQEIEPSRTRRRPRIRALLTATAALGIVGLATAGSATAVAASPTAIPVPAGVGATVDAVHSAATLTWAPATSGSGVTGYVVARDGVDIHGYGAWSTKLPATATRQTFTSLAEYSTYHLTVRAVTAAGMGAPATVTVVFGAFLGTGPAYLAAVHVNGTTSALVTWDPPGGRAPDPNLQGYIVSRDGVDSHGYGAWSTRLSTSQKSIVFTNLIPGDTYNLKVLSYDPITQYDLGLFESVNVTI